ncbi:hypothetical protein V6N12_048577 [Hibiscus sabdariffa]|uniref:Uncharacterized protein n=1 Tax=Hibiscus sabdariffa TaxID=183260 RepID=A0ABR2EHN8_9ROSI
MKGICDEIERWERDRMQMYGGATSINSGSMKLFETLERATVQMLPISNNPSISFNISANHIVERSKKARPICAMDIQSAEHEHVQPLLKNTETAAGETAREEPKTVSECPLLQPILKQPKTKKQKIVRKTFKGTAILSKLLPTGSALTFQLLSPIVTNNGRCRTEVCQNMLLCLVAFCTGVCFFLSFTDSHRDERGKVRYGVATFRGLWVMDGKVQLSVEEANKYKLKFIDFFHALVSVMIFMALVLFDQNVVNCFRPKTADDSNELWLMVLPASIGAIGCLLFVCFPSKRHGIGRPLSKN